MPNECADWEVQVQCYENVLIGLLFGRYYYFTRSGQNGNSKSWSEVGHAPRNFMSLLKPFKFQVPAPSVYPTEGTKLPFSLMQPKQFLMAPTCATEPKICSSTPILTI